MNKKIMDLSKPLAKSNKHLRHSTNYYLLQKHFLLKAVEDVNNELTKNSAGFVIDVSEDLHRYFQTKLTSHIDLIL